MRKVFLNEKYELARLKGRLGIEEVEFIKKPVQRHASEPVSVEKA